MRSARRPAGWTAPGPAPRAANAIVPAPGEDLCYLCGDWRILQRIDGHRWSLDDLLTAWCATRALEPRLPDRILDLGCGIGSVLLMLAWRFPGAHLLGIEAQAVSVHLARRSIAWNGCERRVRVRLGDLRRSAGVPPHRFDLVTGTPPYLAPGTARESRRIQRAPCTFEHRGGVEAYCGAAARALGPDGAFVVCEQAGQEARVHAAADGAGLAVARSLPVVPRSGKPPLFAVFELRHRDAAGAHHALAPLVVRDTHGARTPEFLRVRRDLGLPP